MTDTNTPNNEQTDFQIKDYYISNKTYDILKFVVQIGLPAFATFYFTLASIWQLPSPEKIVGTTVAVTTFLGVLLRITSRSYNDSNGQYDGALNISEREDGVKVYSLDLNIDASLLDGKKNVSFKVDKSNIV
jgi:hypothetical protein